MNDLNLFEFRFRRSSRCPGVAPIISTRSKILYGEFSPVPLRARDYSEKRLRGNTSYATQRVPKGLSGFDGRPAGLVQFAQGAVRCVFVDVAQRRVVEDRVDEEVYVATEAQAGQTDVNQLAG